MKNSIQNNKEKTSMENKTNQTAPESMSEIKKANELKSNLRHFCGTENYHRHFLGVLYTDGVKFLAEEAEAYGLIDAISSYQTKNLKENYPFQIWELKVNTNNSCVLTMIEDTNCPEIVHQEIEYTDFPLDYIKLYFIDNILLLTSEY